MNSSRQSEIICSICGKPVTLHDDTGADEDGKAVHKECYASRIAKDDQRATPPAQ